MLLLLGTLDKRNGSRDICRLIITDSQLYQR
jgi:hypothetical protein